MLGLGVCLTANKFRWVTDFGLDDPSIIPYGVTITNRSRTSLTFVYEGSDPRRRIAWPIQPTGTRYRFNLNVTGDTYFRIAETDGLGPSGQLNLAPMYATGSYAVDVTMPSYSVSTAMGFLISTIGSTVTITDWSVKFP